MYIQFMKQIISSVIQVKRIKIKRNTIKRKFFTIVIGMLFDAAGSWSLGNEFARNDVIFVVDNNLSGLSENRKINF